MAHLVRRQLGQEEQRQGLVRGLVRELVGTITTTLSHRKRLVGKRVK